MNDEASLYAEYAGEVEVPGLDENWETFSKRTDQTVTYTDDLVDPPVERTLVVKTGTVLKIYRTGGAPGYGIGEGPDIESFSDDIEEYQDKPLAAPVGPGETLYFELHLVVEGDGQFNFGVVVVTPPNPTGGFQVSGQSLFGTIQGGAFGADMFNHSAGVIGNGAGFTPGTVVARVRGVLGNGPAGGLLKFQLGPAIEANPIIIATISFETFADCAII